MGIDGFFHFIDALPQLLLLDLLLSGDNAVVIALACRSLPPEQMRSAMLIGTGGAIVLRILMATVVGLLLKVPLLKLVGGVMLVVIAIKLLLAEEEDRCHAADAEAPGSVGLWSAVSTVIVADVVMSLDNVVGLAAVAQGDLLLLSLGLLISMPLLMFGSVFVTSLLQRYPLLVRAGGAMLGWIGGDIAVSDPIFADWVNQQSPALTVVVPVLTAIFVLWECRIIEQRRPGLASLRPSRPRSRADLPTPFSVERRSVAPAVRGDAAPMIDASAGMSIAVADFFVAQPPTSAMHQTIEASTQSTSETGTPRFSRFLRSRWVPITAAVLLAGVGLDLVSRISLPQPAELRRYDCSGTNATVYFRHGGTNLRLTTGAAYADGSVRQDNQVEWGDYHAAATALGIAPPTHIRLDSEQSVVIDGGGFPRVECTRHNGE